MAAERRSSKPLSTKQFQRLITSISRGESEKLNKYLREKRFTKEDMEKRNKAGITCYDQLYDTALDAYIRSSNYSYMDYFEGGDALVGQCGNNLIQLAKTAQALQLTNPDWVWLRRAKSGDLSILDTMDMEMANRLNSKGVPLLTRMFSTLVKEESHVGDFGDGGKESVDRMELIRTLQNLWKVIPRERDIVRAVKSGGTALFASLFHTTLPLYPSVLKAAIKRDDVEVMGALLRACRASKRDLDSLDLGGGISPFGYALQEGALNAVKFFANNRNINAPIDGLPPLILAVRKDHDKRIAMVNLLLSLGADRNASVDYCDGSASENAFEAALLVEARGRDIGVFDDATLTRLMPEPQYRTTKPFFDACNIRANSAHWKRLARLDVPADAEVLKLAAEAGCFSTIMATGIDPNVALATMGDGYCAYLTPCINAPTLLKKKKKFGDAGEKIASGNVRALTPEQVEAIKAIKPHKKVHKDKTIEIRILVETTEKLGLFNYQTQPELARVLDLQRVADKSAAQTLYDETHPHRRRQKHRRHRGREVQSDSDAISVTDSTTAVDPILEAIDQGHIVGASGVMYLCRNNRAFSEDKKNVYLLRAVATGNVPMVAFFVKTLGVIPTAEAIASAMQQANASLITLLSTDHSPAYDIVCADGKNLLVALVENNAVNAVQAVCKHHGTGKTKQEGATYGVDSMRFAGETLYEVADRSNHAVLSDFFRRDTCLGRHINFESSQAQRSNVYDGTDMLVRSVMRREAGTPQVDAIAR